MISSDRLSATSHKSPLCEVVFYFIKQKTALMRNFAKLNFTILLFHLVNIISIV